MKDLTQGRIDVHLLRMSGAMLLNMLMGTLFSLGNIYWLGRLGAQAQAAVTLSGIPMMLLLTLMPVISMGAGILISHAVGAKDQARANRIFNEAFGASMILIAVIGAIAWVQREAFGSLMTSDPGTAALIATYTRWFIPSIVVQLPLFVLAGALEFTGNVRAGTIAQSATVVLNAILTPILMFGWLGMPKLGLTGTGMASFIACSITMLCMLAYFARKDAYLSMRPSIWFSRPKELWGALKIGLPIGIEGGLVAAYLLVIALLLRPFGPVEQAAFGIGHRVFQAALMPLMALSTAACVIVGQSHGAGMGDRVREVLRTSLIIGGIVGPTLLIVFESFAPWICSRFSDDAAVIAAGSVFLRIGALTFIPSSVAYVVFAVLTGMGNTRASLFTQIAYAALVVLPAFALSRLAEFEPRWLWTVMVVAGCVQALMAWYFLRRDFGKRVDQVPAMPAVEMGTAS
ncbi:MAG: MATE family efflux transporter [Lysobacter sp.]|nr:MATE family efflux transporter [Lysobacter sp.]